MIQMQHTADYGILYMTKISNVYIKTWKGQRAKITNIKTSKGQRSKISNLNLWYYGNPNVIKISNSNLASLKVQRSICQQYYECKRSNQILQVQKVKDLKCDSVDLWPFASQILDLTFCTPIVVVVLTFGPLHRQMSFGPARDWPLLTFDPLHPNGIWSKSGH